MAAATLIVSLLILYTRIEKLVGVLEKRYRKKSNLLKEIHLKHKSYIQNAPSGIITFNKRLEITDCNNKICRMTDYNSDELLDMTVEKLYNDPDESKRKMFLNKLYVKGNSKDVLQIKTKNGRNIHILLSACKISDELFLCNALDVTKQVNMDRSLKVLNSQLEKMNKELEEKIEEETLKNKTQQAKIAEQRQFIDMVQMMSAVAHQWRQPLNALGLHIQDLYDSITLSENDLVFVKKFEKTSMELINQMSSTIDDFTEIAKKNKNKTEFSVIDEVVDSLNLINIQLSSSGVTFEPSCRSDCEDCPQNVLYDLEECRRKDTTLFGIPSELKQIIQHIVINSIESIEERAEKESGFEGIVKAVIECKKGRFIITIEDNGYGVSEERLYKIFNPYYTTKDITQKQGMGLYIVKSVVENSFHGEVEAFNNINGGLSVRMSIPMRNNN
jgi:PAS domain S-box-containing protein